mmetsp:Transcript_100702/g.288606  ORF Transcript_100702/g.288606 Transcript_100702/m.288606 type:complete len:171 (+) Transcript_100702:1382-1894(+)
MGELAVSRAFGDAEFKKGINEILGDDAPTAGSGGRADNNPDTDLSKPLIIAEPEVQAVTLIPADDFLLLACDGLFDVLTNQEVSSRHADCQLLAGSCSFPYSRWLIAIKVAPDRHISHPTDYQACDLILAEMARHGDVQRAAEALSRNAIDDCGSRDNVSILIVLLRQPW